MTHMARGSDGCTGYEEVMGQTPDISKWLNFEFYDLVWWLDHPTKPNITDPQRQLTHWLCVSCQVSYDLCYWLITDSGKLISKSSVEHVICDDYLNEDKKKEINNFNRKAKLNDLLNVKNFMLKGNGKFQSMYLEDIDNNPVFNPSIAYPGVELTAEDYGDMVTKEWPDEDNLDNEVIEKYINVELIFGIGTNN